MSTQIIERMAVEVEGQGDAVILVHGLGGSSNVFQPQLAALGGRFRLVRPDLPGSGRSRPGGDASIPAWVARLRRMAEVLGIERAHLVGHSLGTILCQHLAVDSPRLVRSLALFGPLLAPPEANRAAIRERARQARGEGMAGIAAAIVLGTLSGDSRTRNPVGAALVRELLMRQDPEGYALTCEALAAAQPAEIGRIRCPALLVTGDEDPIAPPSAVRAMAERLPGARVQVLERCGHWATIERWSECSRTLGELYAGRA
ncbi:MAG: alpha/beta hydrolase [Dongiaceae bacterium]